MGQHKYKAWNGPMPTTAAQLAVATGTAIKTMLQIAPPASRQITIIEWGYSCNVNSAGGGFIELLQTDVAATVTAHVAAGVQPQFPGVPASLATLGAAATGYTASAEGAITATRVFDVVDLQPDNGAPSMVYNKVFMPDVRPVVAVSTFLRVRVTTGNSTNMHCYVVWEE